MTGHVRRLTSENQRDIACRIIRAAPLGSVVRVTPPGRTLPQNARMHAMLSDVSIAKPEGRHATPDVWKALLMNACGHEVQFETGLDGRPFPIGFRSSALSKAQMSDLIEFMLMKGAEWGVEWSEPEQ
jgi:hypothetical protein